MKDVIFAKIRLYDNASGYHAKVLSERESVTLPAFLAECEKAAYFNLKNSIEITYVPSEEEIIVATKQILDKAAIRATLKTSYPIGRLGSGRVKVILGLSAGAV